MQDTRVWFFDWKDPLEKEMATQSSTLASEIPWTGEPGGLQPMGLQESDMTERTVHHPSRHYGGQRVPSQWSLLLDRKGTGDLSCHGGPLAQGASFQQDQTPFTCDLLSKIKASKVVSRIARNVVITEQEKGIYSICQLGTIDTFCLMISVPTEAWANWKSHDLNF